MWVEDEGGRSDDELLLVVSENSVKLVSAFQMRHMLMPAAPQQLTWTLESVADD